MNIFDYKKNLYGERLMMVCHAYIRQEKAFETKETLRMQLIKDKEQVLQTLQHIHA